MRLVQSVFCLIVLICLAGCETIAAVGSGKVRVSDVTYLASSGSPGVPTIGSGIDVSDAQSGYYPAASGTQGEFWGNVQEADTWLQDNLW